MSIWSGMGTSSSGAYNGWSDYTNAVADIEDPKWLPLFTNFPRIRAITAYAANGSNDVVGGVVTPSISTTLTRRWVLKVKAYDSSKYILYGTTNNDMPVTDHPELSRFIPSAYANYRLYVLDEATWAQDNGMDAFCIGNEMLISAAHSSTVGMIPTSITRSSNVATATFGFDHGLTTGDYITVGSGTDTSFRVADSETAETIQCTVTGARTFTYASIGSDGTATGTYKINWSALEVIRKLKSLAHDVQSVFTRGPITYSESQGHTAGWIILGITPNTDLDLWSLNAYGTSGLDAAGAGRTSWLSEVDTCWAAFGTNMILSEFNCVLDGNPLGYVNGLTCDQRGFEQEHAKELAWRLNYLIGLGMTQVYYFGSMQGQMGYNTWPSNTYGNKYFRGENRPVYNAMRRERVDRLFLGTGAFDGGTPYWG